MAIEHVVIIVKENHTLDNYFGALPGADGQQLARAANPPPVDPLHDHLTWMRRAGDSRFHVQYTRDDIPITSVMRGTIRFAITTSRRWRGRRPRTT
jgi:phospholipase C